MGEGNAPSDDPMIGEKYLEMMLALLPKGFWLVLDNNSDETKWGVMAIKLYFGSERACADAKAIFDSKNANLVTANQSGRMTHPLTIRNPFGKLMRNLEGNIRKEMIPVPFFRTSNGPVCLLPQNSNACLRIVRSYETIYKTPAPPNAVRKHDSHPHARVLLILIPKNPESPASLYPTRRRH